MRDNIGGTDCMGRETVTLGSSDMLYSFFLTPLLKAVCARYPGIKINADDNGTLANEENLMNGGLDLFVTHLPASRPGLTAEVICQEPLILVVPKGHPVEQYAETDPGTGRRYIDLRHMNGQSMVLPFKYYRDRQVMNKALDSNGVKLAECVDLRRYITIFSYISAFQMVSMGPYSAVKGLYVPETMNCYYIREYENAYSLAVLYPAGIPLLNAAKILKNVIMEVVPSLYVDISAVPQS